VLKKPKISLPMSLVFAEEKCTRAVLDFLNLTDVGTISGVVEEAENSDHEGSSDGGGVKVDAVFAAVSFVSGEEDSRLCFGFLCYEKSGEEICTGYMPWPLAPECNMITNKQTSQSTTKIT